MEPTKKLKVEKKGIFNLDDLIAFRRKMHSYPEIGFKEFVTQESIKQYLFKIGIQESQMKKCGQTGWTVDIWGKAPKQGSRRFIALRADIDALSMTEANDHLEYRSQTENGHHCGHDGHTTTLLGFTSLFLEQLDQIPSNKGVRLLFQPSEEGPVSGALAMLKDNCLEGVDECYGYHNWPTHPVGYVMVQPGCQMAAQSVIKIDLIGLGGHGSTPEKCIDPIQMALQFHLKFQKMTQEKFKGRGFMSTMPVLQGGERYNVIAESAHLEGTLRSLEEGFQDEFKDGLIQILEQIKADFKGSDYVLDFINTYPAVMNTKKETQIVVDLAKQQFGEDKVGDFGMLPVKASEDFCFYIKQVPGCFFFLGSGRKFDDIMLHDCKFDFNDNLIEPGSQFFLKLVRHRLEL